MIGLRKETSSGENGGKSFRKWRKISGTSDHWFGEYNIGVDKSPSPHQKKESTFIKKKKICLTTIAIQLNFYMWVTELETTSL